MNEREIIEGLKNAIINYDSEGAAKLANMLLNLKIDPLKAIDEGLAMGIREIGEKFESGEIFLPELVSAAEAMKNVLRILEPKLKERKKKRHVLGNVLIGTVEGDIHDIGKNIVAALLVANGFEVNDLGIDVPTATFVEKVKETRPDILALSALLTTTLPVQREVIEALKKSGLRDYVKVIVGGASVSLEWSKEIGANGYGVTASEAVNVVKELMHVPRRK